MNDTEKARILDDLLKIVNHDDFDEETMDRVYHLLEYHGLIKARLLDYMGKEGLRERVLYQFKKIGEIPDSVR